MNEGPNDVAVTVTSHDSVGNETSKTAHQNVTLDTHAETSITIDDVTTDNILNHDELDNSTVTVHGHVGGDAAIGDKVTLNIGGHSFSGNVIKLGDGHLGYSIDVNSRAFSNNKGEIDTDVGVHATIISHDIAGNEATSYSDHIVHIDNHANNDVTINTVAGNDWVDGKEYQNPISITGDVTGPDAKVGDDVLVNLNGHDIPGKVVAGSDGKLHYDVPVSAGNFIEGLNEVTVTVTSHDKVGNTAHAVSNHFVAVDTHADATITVDGITKDNVLNHDELDHPKHAITGTVGGDARVGDLVTLDINGHKYTGHVIDLGNDKLGYSIDVDSGAFSNNKGHIETHVNFTASVTSHDAVGNETTETTHHTVNIDNFAKNSVDIGLVAGDDTVNAIESRMPTMITGNVDGDAKVGDNVVVTVNGLRFSGEVVPGDDGKLHYEIPLPNSALKEGPNDVHVSVTSHDAAGNEVTTETSHNVTLDTFAETTISIDDVTIDNVLNHDELASKNQLITGTVGKDASIGDRVDIEVNGTHFSGNVIDLGHGQLGYSIPVDPSVFAHNQGEVDTDVTFHATVTSHDAAGNEASDTTSHTVHIDNHANNHVTINTTAGDGVVNKVESQGPTAITGEVTGPDARAGDKVDVTVDGHTYTGKVVHDDGHLTYHVDVPKGVLKEGNNGVKVEVTSHDSAGNITVGVDFQNVKVDTHARTTITIDNVTEDNILNHDELNAPKQMVSGLVGGDASIGDKVDIEIGGQHFYGKVIDLGGGKLGYSIPVDPEAFNNNKVKFDGDVTFHATVTSHDEAGNVATKTTTGTVHIDNHADVNITVGTVSGDNFINGVESHHEHTTVTGTVSGDVGVGDKVIVAVNGHNYETRVEHQPHLNGALGYSVDVNTDDLVADPNITASITGHDDAHNTHTVTVPHGLTIDLTAEATITIDKVTGDNIINGAESGEEFTDVTGTVGGDAKVGDLVHLYVNGNDLTGRVVRTDDGLGFSIKVSTNDLMADPHLTATVTATDEANNSITVSDSQKVKIDTHADATITVDKVAFDDTLNGDELKHGYTIVSGIVTGEMKPGDSIHLNVNGHNYDGFVEDQGNGKMGYHIPVGTGDIQAGGEHSNISATITVIDHAGNTATATTNHHVGIDDHADASVTINAVSGDDVLNKLDQESPTTTVSGTVGGDVKDGDVVHLMINDKPYNATVHLQIYPDGQPAGLGYSIEVDTKDLLADPNFTATVTATDDAGNTATTEAHHSITEDHEVNAGITIDKVTKDNVINNVEAHNPHTTITGTVSGDVHIGDPVDLMVNEQHYYGRVEDLGNNKGLGYRIDVSTDDLISEKDPKIHASVTGYDGAGNTVSAEADRNVLVDTRADVHLEHGTSSPQKPDGPDLYDVKGYVSGDDIHVDDLVHVTTGSGSQDLHVEVMADGRLGYHFTMRPDEVRADPNVKVEITKTDKHGNTTTLHDNIHVDLVPENNSDNNGNGNQGNGNHNGNQGNGNHDGNIPWVPLHPVLHANITVSPVAGDNWINKVESTSNSAMTVIRGTVTGDVHVGDKVTVDIGGKLYDGTVFERPNLPGEYGYAVDVGTDVLKVHPNFTVSMFNGTSHTDGSVQVDTDVNATITIDKIAGDGVINIAEAASGTTSVTGTVSGDNVHVGSNVTIEVNGHKITTQVLDGLRYKADVSIDDLRQDPNITVSVTGNDDHGNSMTATADTHVTVDTQVSANVSIDDVTTDNVLNADESKPGGTFAITGKVSGDVDAGDHVKVMVNDHEYDAVVDATGKYKVDALTDDLKLDQPNNITAEVTGHDDAGNTTLGTANHGFSVDTQAGGTITVNTVSGDDILSAKDLASGTTTVSGRVGGDAQIGDPVTIMVNGHPYTTNVIALPNMNGVLGYRADVKTDDLKVDQTIDVSVKGHDSVDNEFEAHSDRTLSIDDHADAGISINDVSGDNVLNEAETHHPTTEISGKVTGDVHVGDKVVVTVNGNNLLGVIEKDETSGDLTFKVNASTNDLLNDPHITYSVTGTDDVGNTYTFTTDKTITVDRIAENHIHIDMVAGDDTVNIDEYNAGTTSIKGTVDDDAHAGDTVTLTVNGKTFHGNVVDHNGMLTYDIPVDNDALNEGANDVVVNVSGQDAAGNTATSTDHRVITVDTHIAASIHLNDVTTDNVVNNQESANIHITGTVGEDAKDGDEVKLDVNGHPATGKVSGGGYDILVDKSWLNEGDNNVKVSVTASDEAGNTETATTEHHFVLDTHADASINLGIVAGDNIVNAQESGDIHITGTVGKDAKAGDEVTLEVNNHSVTGHVSMVDGHLGYDIPMDKSWLNEGDNDVKVTVSVTDAAGNNTTATDNHNVVLDTHADASIILGTVAGDNVVNDQESANIHITGTVGKDATAGDEVTLEVNNHSVTGHVSMVDGHWGYDIPMDKSWLHEGDNDVKVTVSVTDAAGNNTTATDNHNVVLDTHADATITIDPVTADNVINVKESADIHVTGAVAGDAHDGDLVTLNVNGHTIETKVVPVGDHLGYDVRMDKTWLNEGENNVTVNVQVTDDAGNRLIPAFNQVVTLDTHADATITVNPVTADNTINAAEAKHISVTGTVDGDAKVGDSVKLEVNGHSINAKVEMVDGHKGYSIQLDKAWVHEGHNDLKVSVSVTDAAGNHFTTPPVIHPVYVDTQIHASIDINPVAAHNVVNANMAEHVTITGSVGQDVKLGDHVSLEVNNHPFTAEVKEVNGRLGYEAQIDKAWLNEGDNDLKVRVTTEDHAGNTTSAYHSQTINLDTHANGTITIDPVAGDNVINAKESQHMIHVTGKVDGDAHDGDLVTLNVNGHTIETKVVPVGDHLGYDVRMNKAWLHEGENNVTVNVRVTDDAGNRVTPAFNQVVVLDTHAEASITVNPVAGDNVINASEMKHISLTGQVGGDAKEGDKVTLDINHHTVTTDVKMIDGHLGYNVDISKSWVHEGHNELNVGVKVTDAAGNTATAHYKESFQVDTRTDATLTVNKIAGDNHINAQEARHDVTQITGQVEGDVHRGDHVTATIGDKQYDAVIHEHKGHLSYDIPVNTADLHAGNNSVNVSVTAQDAHGNNNLIEQNVDVTVDAPSHHGKHDVDIADKSLHAANAPSHDHGLSNLFGDDNDSFSFNLAHDSKGHHGDEGLKVFTGKENGHFDKVDLSDLAHELHEGTDIAQMIKVVEAPQHQGKGSAADAVAPAPAVPGHTGDAHHAGYDSAGSATHSLDHLIPKPEQFHS
nr:Ig-like domain-containing protein [Buttiauxella sp. A2-C1_F]